MNGSADSEAGVDGAVEVAVTVFEDVAPPETLPPPALRGDSLTEEDREFVLDANSSLERLGISLYAIP